MRYRDCVLLLAAAPLWLQAPAGPSPEEQARINAQNTALREIVKQAPKLPLQPGALEVQPPSTAGWALGMVSWVAAGPDGLIYLLQRGEQADPVIVIDRTGKIVRSWGKGMYTTPHAIRVDPQGNIWTTDAASSMVYKFSPQGEKLLAIEVGGQPSPCGRFCSTTDVAFAPNGQIYIADGYRNARILEYTPQGRKVREWGERGHRARSVPLAALDPGGRQRHRLRRRSRERPHSAIRSTGEISWRVVAVRQDVRLEGRRRCDLVVEHPARTEHGARLADQTRSQERHASRAPSTPKAITAWTSCRMASCSRRPGRTTLPQRYRSR